MAVFTLTAFHEILPFMAMEWLSVVLGLVFTEPDFCRWSGDSAGSALGSGMSGPSFLSACLVVSVVAGVWEFATSGLEMSLVFLWLGAVVSLPVDPGRGPA